MGALPEQESSQVRYTIVLGDRDTVWPELTDEEAHEMLAVGFRFSIFDPAKGAYNISIPYSVLQIVGRDELTFMQDV